MGKFFIETKKARDLSFAKKSWREREREKVETGRENDCLSHNVVSCGFGTENYEK